MNKLMYFKLFIHQIEVKYNEIYIFYLSSPQKYDKLPVFVDRILKIFFIENIHSSEKLSPKRHLTNKGGLR